jgi:hypothetical protein
MLINEITIDEPIKPKDVSIFIEDGVPYMKYIGTTTLSNGVKVEVECQKMSLVLKGMESESESVYDCTDYFGTPKVMTYKREFYAVEDAVFTVKTLERACKKEDLEKELGYKLTFTD